MVRRTEPVQRSGAPGLERSRAPVIVLTLLFAVFGGGLALKAWEESRLASTNRHARQVIEAQAAAARIELAITRARAGLEAAIAAGAGPATIARVSGLADISSASAPPAARLELLDNGKFRVSAETTGERWISGDMAVDTSSGRDGVSGSIVRAAGSVPLGVRTTVAGPGGQIETCAPLQTEAYIVCIASPTAPFGVTDWSRIAIYVLLAAAPALAVVGLLQTLSRQKPVRTLPPQPAQPAQPAPSVQDLGWRDLEVPGLIGFWRWDPGARTLFLGRQAAEMLGIRPGAISLDDFRGVLADDDRERVTKTLREADPFGQISTNFHCHRRGSTISLEMFGGASEGSYSGALLNASEKVAANQRSRLAEIVARTAIDAHPGPFAIWDSRRRLTHWNAVFARDFNLDPDIMQAGASYDYIMAEIAKFVRVERPLGDDANGRELLLISDRWIRLVDRRTARDGLISVGLDLTSLKRNEVELSRSDKRLRSAVTELERAEGQARELAAQYADAKARAERALQAKTVFLANMSHELRTPLNAINGFSEMIASEVYGPLGDERYRGYAEDILGAGQHLLDMINDILDMAKVEAGKMRIDPRPINASDAVDAAVRLIRRRAADKQVSLVFDPDDDLPDINGDHRALKQMSLNLIANAIKFTDAGGQIRVEVRREGDWILVRVADTGVGIPEADLPRLGQPFEQARSPDGRHTGGTGLGLALTKSFAEMHGGHLRLESKVGVGTTVSIFLPVPRRQETRAAAPARKFPAEPGSI